MAADGKPKKTRKHKTDDTPLTVQEVRFCQAIQLNNASHQDAYTQAGFPPRASYSAIGWAANALLKKPKIQAYMQELVQAASDAGMVCIEEIAQGARRIAKANWKRLHDKDGNLLPVTEWPDEVMLAVETIEYDKETGEVIRVKLAGRHQAWDRLAKWKGMIGEKPEGVTKPDALVVSGADPGKL